MTQASVPKLELPDYLQQKIADAFRDDLFKVCPELLIRPISSNLAARSPSTGRECASFSGVLSVMPSGMLQYPLFLSWT